jgi:hypothetical protein
VAARSGRGAVRRFETGSVQDSQSIGDDDLSHDEPGGVVQVKTRYSLKESKQTLVVL